MHGSTQSLIFSSMKFHNALILHWWSPFTFVLSPARSNSVAVHEIHPLKAQVSQGPLQISRTLADSLLVSLTDQSFRRLRALTVYSSDLMANINRPRKPHSHQQECLTHIVWISHGSPRSPSCYQPQVKCFILSVFSWNAGGKHFECS